MMRLSSPGASTGIGIDRAGARPSFGQFLRILAPTVVPASATRVVMSKYLRILQRTRKVFEQRLGKIVIVALFVAAISLIAPVQYECDIVGEDVGGYVSDGAPASAARSRVE